MFGLPASIRYSTLKSLSSHLPNSVLCRTEYLRLPFGLSIWREPLASSYTYRNAAAGEFWERLSNLTGSSAQRGYAKERYKNFLHGISLLANTPAEQHATLLPSDMQSMGNNYTLGWSQRESVKPISWAKKKLGVYTQRGPTVGEKAREVWDWMCGDDAAFDKGDGRRREASGLISRGQHGMSMPCVASTVAGSSGQGPSHRSRKGRIRSWFSRESYTRPSKVYDEETYIASPHSTPSSSPGVDPGTMASTSQGRWCTASKIALTAVSAGALSLAAYRTYHNPHSALRTAFSSALGTVASLLPESVGRGASMSSMAAEATGVPAAPD